MPKKIVVVHFKDIVIQNFILKQVYHKSNIKKMFVYFATHQQ